MLRCCGIALLHLASLTDTTSRLGVRSMRRNAVGAAAFRPYSAVRAFAGERSVNLVQHLLFLPRIAWRKMERLDTAHVGVARDSSGRRGGQMRPLGGQTRIGLCERR